MILSFYMKEKSFSANFCLHHSNITLSLKWHKKMAIWMFKSMKLQNLFL